MFVLRVRKNKLINCIHALKREEAKKNSKSLPLKNSNFEFKMEQMVESSVSYRPMLMHPATTAWLLLSQKSLI